LPVSLERCDLVGVAPGCPSLEWVILVIEILFSTGCSTSMNGFMDHHFCEEGGIATYMGLIKSRIISSEEARTLGRRIASAM